MKRIRLFTDEDILSRFKRRLEGATRIHIATAWATPGKQLDALGTAVQENGLEVRAIVGTHGNATDPAALERLKKLGKLRLAGNEALFHPKVYIFEFSRKPITWIGSANFTRAGFGGGNVEIMYETYYVEHFGFLWWFEEQWSQLKPATEEAINEYRKRYERNPPSWEFQKFVGESESAAPGPLLPPEAQTWDPVLDPEEISSAFERMRTTLTDRPGVEDGMVMGNDMVYWRTDLRYWCTFADPVALRERGIRQGYWNAFGLTNPEGRQTLPPIIIELNPPFDGNSERAWRYTGLFVRNDRGDIFLARNLNRIPGVDEEDLERRLNKRLPGRVVDVPWRRRTRRMVVLGEVDSGELRDAVAELVRLVAELRAAGD